MNDDFKIRNIRGTCIPLRGNDIDTDRIVPARYLKEITFSHMGEYVFFDQRFDASGKRKDHPFNDPKFSKASILIVNKNFGCGSSREHAAQAIKRFGISAIIGESFSPIFSANCTALGIPAVQVDFDGAELLMKSISENPKTLIDLSLPEKKIAFAGKEICFDMPEQSLNALIGGFWNITQAMLENIGQTREVSRKLPYIQRNILKAGTEL